MFSSLFTVLYEALCGENSGSPEYRESIYSSVGLLTIVLSALFAILFYLVLGRWRNVWHKRWQWAVTILISALTGFTIAFYVAKSQTGNVDGYLYEFALFTALLAGFYFVALSFVCKPFSIYSKRTPI